MDRVVRQEAATVRCLSGMFAAIRLGANVNEVLVVVSLTKGNCPKRVYSRRCKALFERLANGDADAYFGRNLNELRAYSQAAQGRGHWAGPTKNEQPTRMTDFTHCPRDHRQTCWRPAPAFSSALDIPRAQQVVREITRDMSNKWQQCHPTRAELRLADAALGGSGHGPAAKMQARWVAVSFP